MVLRWWVVYGTNGPTEAPRMPEYSQEDANRARNIVQRCLNREAESLKLEQDLAVSDVESDTYAFLSDLDVLRDVGGRVPALPVSDDLVPVSLPFAIGFPAFGFDRSTQWPMPLDGPGFDPYWRRHPLFYDHVKHTMSALRDERDLYGFAWISREEGQSTFLKRSTDFVATRIAGVRGFRELFRGQKERPTPLLNVQQFLRGRPVATPGCNFTVSTDSGGLRVFWSGAYYVTPNYFNHPTSPTSRVLQSGTYVFGVDGGAYGNNIQWDHNAVVSLPGPPQVHLNY